MCVLPPVDDDGYSFQNVFIRKVSGLHRTDSADRPGLRMRTDIHVEQRTRQIHRRKWMAIWAVSVLACPSRSQWSWWERGLGQTLRRRELSPRGQRADTVCSMPELPEFTDECFFISPIGTEGSLDRSRSDQVMNHIVAPAAEALGLTVVRADQISEPGHITLQVIEHCLHAKAAVADLTGSNPNVFYELGIRHTAELPVVQISSPGTIPFDLAQVRTISYVHTDLDSAMECRKSLSEHLRNALKGRAASPVSTSKAQTRLREHGGEQSRTIAAMLTAMETLNARFTHVEAGVERLTDAAHSGRDFDPEGNEVMIFAWARMAIGLLKGTMRDAMVARLGLADGKLRTIEEVAGELQIDVDDARTLERQAFRVWASEGFREEWWRHLDGGYMVPRS